MYVSGKGLSTLMLVMGLVVIVGGLVFMVFSVSTSFCAGPPGACQVNYDYNLLVLPFAVGGAFMVAALGMRYLKRLVE